MSSSHLIDGAVDRAAHATRSIVAVSLSQETDLLLSADDRGAQSVHWNHAANCRGGPHSQIGCCTCSKVLFTREHLENYTALLRTVEEKNERSRVSTRQTYRPRLNREAVEAVSDSSRDRKGAATWPLADARGSVPVPDVGDRKSVV